MKVKLSYTVELEDVLTEGALLLANHGADVQKIINSYAKMIEILQETEGRFSLLEFREKVEDLGTAMEKIATRVAEISNIVEGYVDYNGDAPLPPAESELEVALEDAEDLLESATEAAAAEGPEDE